MHVLSVAIQNWNPYCLAAHALSNISCEQFVCSSCWCFGLLLSLFLSVSVHTILCKTYKAYQVYFLVQCSLANNLSGVTSTVLHAFHGFVFIHTATGISAFPTTVFFVVFWGISEHANCSLLSAPDAIHPFHVFFWAHSSLSQRFWDVRAIHCAGEWPTSWREGMHCSVFWWNSLAH